MILTDYPGHLLAGALVIILAGLLVWAYRTDVVRRTKAWRWLLLAMQYCAVIALAVILWNPSSAQRIDADARNTVLVFFDTSQSMSLADQNEKERLENAIEVFKRRFRPENPNGPQYRLYGFDWRCYSAEDMDGLRRWGDQSDLRRVLGLIGKHVLPEQSNRPAAEIDLEQRRTVGALIFTDGQADDKNAQAYTPLPDDAGMVVAFVGIGSTELGGDVAVRSIRAPASAIVGTAYRVETTVQSKGALTDPVRVELLKDDLIIDFRELSPADIGAETALEFRVPADTLGPHCITARARGPETELNKANNVRRTTVDVIEEDALRVLLYAETANFDIGKIRQGLERDTKIHLDFGLNAIVKASESDAERGMSGHVELPKDKQGFYQYDVIILGPCDFARFSPAQLDGLYGFVAERGGGLILVPGRGSQDVGWAKNPQIKALLPIKSEPPSALGEKGNPELTPAGLDSSILKEGDLDEDHGDVSLVYSSVEKKPAASVLAVANEVPFLCTHRLGRGRVCLINGRNMFRLYRENLDGGVLRKLFSGLTAYLGRTTELEAGIDLFAKRKADEPRTVQFDAYVYNKAFDLVSGANVLLDMGGAVLRMDQTAPGHYVAEIKNLADESIVARAEGELNGVFLGQKTLTSTLPLPHSEMDEVELDEAFLGALAKRIGGQYHRADMLDENAPALFDAPRQTTLRGALDPVWPSWPVLISLCVWLTALWVIRRAVGLM